VFNGFGYGKWLAPASMILINAIICQISGIPKTQCTFFAIASSFDRGSYQVLRFLSFKKGRGINFTQGQTCKAINAAA
jgi:hypothetical protein